VLDHDQSVPPEPVGGVHGIEAPRDEFSKSIVEVLVKDGRPTRLPVFRRNADDESRRF
jgi:hypothetical protein